MWQTIQTEMSLRPAYAQEKSLYCERFWTEEDDKFYCQINLTLKDFGKVDLMMAMYDTNKIDLTIYAQRDHFKTAVKENLQSLKQALNEVELIPVNIKLLDLKEDNEKTTTEKKTDVFVNPYSTQTNSVDIRV